MRLLRLLAEGRYDEADSARRRYLGLEDCRDGISPIRVLHDAVTLAGVADMGPMLPLLTGLSAAERERAGGARAGRVGPGNHGGVSLCIVRRARI